MGGPRTGSAIGAIGGVLFVVLNAGPLGSPASTVLRAVGVVAFAVVVWFAVLRPGARRPGARPERSALRTYGFCVVGEVVAIVLGAQVLLRLLDRPGLVLPWVVLVVGVHFVPFARAFGVPLFAVLGGTLIAVGLVGGVLTVVLGPGTAVPSALTGVVAGFVLLAFAGAGGTRPTR